MRTGAPADKNRLKQLNWRVKAALDDHRANQWQENLKILNPEDRSMWKTCRALRQTRKPIPSIHGNKGIVYEKRDKANAFADTLERQFQENDIDDDDAEACENIVNRRARRSTNPARDVRGATGNPAAPEHQKSTKMGRDRKHCAQKTFETRDSCPVEYC